jgi:hypothetical protein
MILSLTLLAGRLTICRLAPDAPLPAWALPGPLVSLTRTAEELSVVCAAADVPAGIPHDPGWRAFKLEGPFDLEMVGVLASVVAPLAEAGVSVFALATYDTDYLLVKESQLERAIVSLAQHGHGVTQEETDRQ